MLLPWGREYQWIYIPALISFCGRSLRPEKLPGRVLERERKRKRETELYQQFLLDNCSL